MSAPDRILERCSPIEMRMLKGDRLSDDHTFDVMVMHQGKPIRPYLHAGEDLRSRKIVGWSILPYAPRASDVLRTFVTAVREYGAPKHVVVDNGKSFDARALQGITKKQRQAGITADQLTPAELARVGGAFTVLNCQVQHATTYHGQAKNIERVFGTICRRFSPLFDAYTGNSPSNKPGRGNGSNALKRAIENGDLVSLEEFTARFEQWLALDYNGKAGHRGHAMDRQSPDQAYEANLPNSVRRLPDHILEFATFERVGPVTVHKNGVTWKQLQYGWSNEDLIRRLGHKVILATDERSVDHVYVLDDKGALICRAEANQRLPRGMDKRDLSRALATKSKARRMPASTRNSGPSWRWTWWSSPSSTSRKESRSRSSRPSCRACGSFPPASKTIRRPLNKPCSRSCSRSTCRRSRPRSPLFQCRNSWAQARRKPRSSIDNRNPLIDR